MGNSARPALVVLSLAALGAFVSACGGDGDNKGNPEDASTRDASSSDASLEPDASPPAIARMMYVSTGSEQRLAVVRLEADGTMTALPNLDVELGGNTGAMAYARGARRLYVGVGNSIETLVLDGSGTPSSIGNTPNTGNPTYISLVNGEANIVTVYFGQDEIASHDVSGTPPHTQLGNRINTDVQPHAALVGPGGRVYVPHRDGQTIHWYDESAGLLTKAGDVASAAGVGPRHITFRPDGAFAYVVNEQGDSVTAYSVAGTGALTPLETITTLATPDPGNQNACADIHITPDGKYVYASNRGDNSLAMFSVDGDGNLTSLGFIATEATPREFEMSPDGRTIVVSGQGSGFLQSYSIGTDGTLTALTTGTGVGRLEIGGDPRWAIVD